MVLATMMGEIIWYKNAQVKQNDDNGFRFGWDTMQNKTIFDPIQKIFVMYSNVLLQQDM